MFGELKNPLLYKNKIIPNIGPKPNTKRTSFAEFLDSPNSLVFLINFSLFFFKLFFLIIKKLK